MTYEYACSACSHEWEAEQSIKDEPLKECPACHRPTARRQISRGVGFILKGSGWYADLYSSGSNKPEASADKGDSKPGASDAKDASKSDAGSTKTDASSTKTDAGSTKASASSTKPDTSSVKTSAAA